MIPTLSVVLMLGGAAAVQLPSPDQMREAIVEDVKAALARAGDDGCPAAIKPVNERFAGRASVRCEAESPRRFVAHVSMTTECGTDESLHAFQRKADGRWALLGGSAPETDEDVRSDIKLLVRQRAGVLELISTGVSPQCTSFWNRELTLVQHMKEGAPLSTVSRRERARYTGGAAPYELFETRSGWCLVHAGDSNFEHLVRLHVWCAHTEDERVVRDEPIAATPVDFIDEWLSLDWSEAAAFVGTEARAGARQWHERLAGARPGGHFVVSGLCQDAERGDYRVQIVGPAPDSLAAQIEVSRSDRSFRVVSIASPGEDCRTPWDVEARSREYAEFLGNLRRR